MKEKASLKKLESSVAKIIEHSFSTLEKTKKYGGVLYNLKGVDEHFCGLFSYKSHVTVEFSAGYKLTDPKKLLNGSGKYRRNLKFVNLNDVPLSYFKKLLKEAAKVSKQ